MSVSKKINELTNKLSSTDLDELILQLQKNQKIEQNKKETFSNKYFESKKFGIIGTIKGEVEYPNYEAVSIGLFNTEIYYNTLDIIDINEIEIISKNEFSSKLDKIITIIKDSFSEE